VYLSLQAITTNSNNTHGLKLVKLFLFGKIQLWSDVVVVVLVVKEYLLNDAPFGVLKRGSVVDYSNLGKKTPSRGRSVNHLSIPYWGYSKRFCCGLK